MHVNYECNVFAEVPFTVNPSVAQKFEDLYVRLLSEQAHVNSTEKK